MARLRKLLTELWNFAAIGLILALRVEHFDQRAFARLAAFLGEIDVAQVFLEECVGGVDPVADRGDRQHLIDDAAGDREMRRSEEHTSELQSLMRISYAVFCLKK